jgi:hypothetical protein
MVDVLQDLLLLRVVLGPRVWLERIAVHHTLNVTRTAWVAVGTPLQGKGGTCTWGSLAVARSSSWLKHRLCIQGLSWISTSQQGDWSGPKTAGLACSCMCTHSATNVICCLKDGEVVEARLLKLYGHTQAAQTRAHDTNGCHGAPALDC